jgi:hypothetical protein
MEGALRRTIEQHGAHHSQKGGDQSGADENGQYTTHLTRLPILNADLVADGFGEGQTAPPLTLACCDGRIETIMVQTTTTHLLLT